MRGHLGRPSEPADPWDGRERLQVGSGQPQGRSTRWENREGFVYARPCDFWVTLLTSWCLPPDVQLKRSSELRIPSGTDLFPCQGTGEQLEGWVTLPGCSGGGGRAVPGELMDTGDFLELWDHSSPFPAKPPSFASLSVLGRLGMSSFFQRGHWFFFWSLESRAGLVVLRKICPFFLKIPHPSPE